MRDAPFAGIYVFFYENFKPILTKTMLIPTENPLIVNMISGLGGGVAATFLTQPFDMIKTRLQLRPDLYKNSLSALTKIIREEGIKGLFSGILPRVLRKSISSAISWSVYEEIVRRYD